MKENQNSKHVNALIHFTEACECTRIQPGEKTNWKNSFRMSDVCFGKQKIYVQRLQLPLQVRANQTWKFTGASQWVGCYRCGIDIWHLAERRLFLQECTHALWWWEFWDPSILTRSTEKFKYSVSSANDLFDDKLTDCCLATFASVVIPGAIVVRPERSIRSLFII